MPKTGDGQDETKTRAMRRRGLAQRRKTAGLTQEQLAARLDVDPTTVARWERGETQPLPWLRPKLARALNVSPERIEALLDEPEPVQPSVPVPAVPVEPVPRQLPAETTGFTGRDAELAVLTRMLDSAAAGPGTVVISAIGGTAGIGKTALALHWAHRVAGRFGDGQLHINLRGFDLTDMPVAPGDAIRGFLDGLGVPAERVPARPDAQAALYRSLLADRKMLIVLDNARDEAQVRPLLPASPGSLVLVTSRRQLSGLAAADDARMLTLDVLTREEAIALLAARIGAARTAQEPEAVDEIVRLCAHLPLALAVAAARAAERPGFPLASLAAELRDADGRLDALDTGDPAASVRAVFSWSYEQLSPDAARLFRLLGLHPGADISVPAAASLAAITVPETRRLLRELARARLIDEHVPGRYSFHDLLRVYAADGARDTDTDADRREAIGRALDHYLHTAAASVNVIHPNRGPIVLAPPSSGASPEAVTDQRQALAWLEAERHILLAIVIIANRGGLGGQFPWAFTRILDDRGYDKVRAVTERPAPATAARQGNAAMQAIRSRVRETAFSELGEAQAQQNLAVLAYMAGQGADAIGHAEQSLRLYRAAGDTDAEAIMLSSAAWYYARLGGYQQARSYCRSALDLAVGTSERRLEGHTWTTLGYAEHHMENPGEAIVCYKRALGIARDSGKRWDEAEILVYLGDAHRTAGRPPQARDAWQQALRILDDMHHPTAARVRARLDALNANALR